MMFWSGQCFAKDPNLVMLEQHFGISSTLCLETTFAVLAKR